MTDSGQWIAMRVVFWGSSPEAAQDLIARAFARYGVSGAVLDVPGETGLFMPGSETPQGNPDQWAVTGYLTQGPEAVATQSLITQEIARLARELEFSFEVQTADVLQEQWSEAWKAYFHPIRVTKKLVVKPTWEPYAAQPGETVIEIDPEMAFGTGSHPTTMLCMRLMEKIVHPQDRVLDVGTGSGILMIWAAALGAGQVAGCDIDPVAIDAAKKNLRHNRVPENQAALFLGGLADAVATGKFNVVVANIHAQANVLAASALAGVLAPGGWVIASGMLASLCRQVQDAFTAQGLSIVDQWEEQEWAALSARLA